MAIGQDGRQLLDIEEAKVKKLIINTKVVSMLRRLSILRDKRDMFVRLVECPSQASIQTSAIILLNAIIKFPMQKCEKEKSEL